MTSAGFTNSLGCSGTPKIGSQRWAPLTSWPTDQREQQEHPEQAVHADGEAQDAQGCQQRDPEQQQRGGQRKMSA